MLNLRLLFVSVVWGINFSLIKYALRDFGPLSFTIVRFFLGSLFLFCVLFMNREPLGVDRKDRPSFILLGLVGITLYSIFFMVGLKYTTASNSALFISLSPLFAALIQTASGKERLTPAGGAGIALATLGVVLIIQGRFGGLNFTFDGLRGDLLTLTASALWALYTIRARPLLGKYSPVKVTAYCMAAGSLMLLPVGVPDLMRQSWRTISLSSWAAFGFAAFIAGGIAYSLWYQGVKRIGASRTIVYHYLMPFAAVLFAALFLHERITALQVLGGVAILAGVALVQKKNEAGMTDAA